jgi:hypothetical protein
VPVHEKVRQLSADVSPEGQHVVGRSLSETVAMIKAKSIRNTVTGCLEWQGHRNQKGYGRIAYNGRYPTTHRVIFVAANGPIHSSVHVLHRCDTENCCEETHLFAGDNFSNQQDRVKKGRFTKLVPEDIFRIRDLLACGCKQPNIAKWFGVTPPTVSRINSGHSWGFVAQVVERQG